MYLRRRWRERERERELRERERELREYAFDCSPDGQKELPAADDRLNLNHLQREDIGAG